MDAGPDVTIRQAIAGLATGAVSAPDLAERAFSAIDRYNPAINALPTLVPRERLREQAARLETAMRRGDPVGPLAGLPYAAKDIHATAGIRTTRGSPIFADHVPTENEPVVQRLLDADALLLGKSNTPEFAAGSQTFNPVLGTTRSPWDLSRTVGGSSGGAAAALGTGMVMVADGSDLAASLRNPAAFCGVVGMRPSSVADPALKMNADVFSALSMVGPLARCVDDLRLAWRAIFAPAPRQPIAHWADSLGLEAERLGRGTASLERSTASGTGTGAGTGAGTGTAAGPRDPRSLRVAWTVDAFGAMPVAEPVRRAMLDAVDRLRAAGMQLVEAAPDFSGADECFQVLRGLYFVETLGSLYRTERARMKDTVVWNIEFGLSLDAERIARAHLTRAAIFERVTRFMREYDAWLLPTAQVLPFGIDVPYPTEINGQPLATYIDWLKSCYWVTVSGHPAVSLPAGFAAPEPGGARRLPVGLQAVGRWKRDEDLFDVAETIEAILAPHVAAQRPAFAIP